MFFGKKRIISTGREELPSSKGAHMLEVKLSPADEALEQMFGYYTPEAELAAPAPNAFEEEAANTDYAEYFEAA